MTMSLSHTTTSSAGRSSALRSSSSRRKSVRVQAIHPPKGKTPEQQPDPFDRHASARDKAQPTEPRPSYGNSSSMFSKQNRRRGRPAHLRSPDDSPLRDGNRDRLIGLLTERAVKTLLVYLQETNPTVYHWLFCWLKENPIPITGTWDEISGEMFLRKMLSTPAETAKIELGRGELFDNIASCGVDPRQMAQRIMEIRVQLSKEFMQDLQLISDENSVLLRETLQVSLANTLNNEPIKKLPPRDLSNVFVHPELLSQDGTLHPEVASSHPELLPVVEHQADRLRTSASPPGDTPEASRGPSPAPTSASASSPSPPPPSGLQPPRGGRPSSSPVPPAGGARRPGGALGGAGAPHAVNLQPPTRRVTGPWKFSGLKPTSATGTGAGGAASTSPDASGKEGSGSPSPSLAGEDETPGALGKGRVGGAPGAGPKQGGGTPA